MLRFRRNFVSIFWIFSDMLGYALLQLWVKSPDEIFMQLEDNQVTLATMKASRYVKAFEKTVDYWERALSHIMETIEMILQVQRQWMYLENIFLGEDIRKQLPKESSEFDGLNAAWKSIMTELNKDPNAR